MRRRRVWTCGCGHDGRLGHGSEANVSSLVELPIFRSLTVLSIHVGGFHTMVRCSEGVYAFGLNDAGQLGLGDCMSRSRPTLVPFFTSEGRDTSQIVDISMGASHTVAWLRDGIYAAGCNDHGQLGLGDFDMRKQFTLIDWPVSSVRHVAAGSFHTLLLVTRPSQADARDATTSADDAEGPSSTSAEGPSSTSAEGPSSTSAEVALEIAPPFLLFSCGKGDFGELGYDADSWDLMRADEARVKQGVRQRAIDQSRCMEAQQAVASITGTVHSTPSEAFPPSTVFKPKPKLGLGSGKPPPARRPAFSRPTLSPVELPPDPFFQIEAGDDPSNQAHRTITRIHAGHHRSGFQTADGAWWCFGCRFNRDVDTLQSSVPIRLSLPPDVARHPRSVRVLCMNECMLVASRSTSNKAAPPTLCVTGTFKRRLLSRKDSSTTAATDDDDDDDASERALVPVPLLPGRRPASPPSPVAPLQQQQDRSDDGETIELSGVNHGVVFGSPDQEVYVLGDNFFGQLGLGHDRPVAGCRWLPCPAASNAARRIESIRCGFRHTVALTVEVEPRDLAADGRSENA